MITTSSRTLVRVLSLMLISLVGSAGLAKAGPGVPTCADTLTAWWPGDGNPNDVSGNGHDGTLQSDAGYATGQESQAFDMTGSGDHVAASDDAAWVFPGPFTIHMWANPSGFATVPNSIMAQTQGGGENNKWIFWIGPNGQDLEFHINGPSPYPVGGYVIPGPFTFSTGTWYHLAVTRDAGGTYRTYVNGSEVGNGTAAMAIPDVVDSLRIGHSAESFQNITFDGLIDEVQIHDAALAPSQLATIFASGTNPWCEICGDGGLDPGEECDDGNTTGGDGCSATCLAEAPPVPALSPLAAATLGLVLLLTAATVLRRREISPMRAEIPQENDG